MIIVFGGAYQGKTDFVREKFKLDDSELFYCTEKDTLHFKKKCIVHLHKFVLGAIKRNENAIDFVKQHLSDLKDKIIICDDISCGIVPLGKELRQYRDNVGKIMQILSREADDVYRVFCGLGEKIK